ncbi:TPA: hypothetical protein ACH3X3_012711 [Trebouxia sp. C0006]
MREVRPYCKALMWLGKRTSTDDKHGSKMSPSLGICCNHGQVLWYSQRRLANGAIALRQELHGGGQTEAAGTRSGYRFGYKFGYSLAYRFELIWQICF